MALSSKLQGENLIVVNNFDMDSIKTSEFVKTMANLETKKTLIVIGDADRNLELSARNVKFTKVLRADGLNVYDILKYEKLILLEGSINKIEGRFAA
jgi:large subunit ribosomal protein L4